MHEHADDVSCLREQDAQRYANTYVDREVGKPIKTEHFDWTNISSSYTFHRPLNLMIVTECEETFKQNNKKNSEDNHLLHI